LRHRCGGANGPPGEIVDPSNIKRRPEFIVGSPLLVFIPRATGNNFFRAEENRLFLASEKSMEAAC